MTTVAEARERGGKRAGQFDPIERPALFRKPKPRLSL